MDGRTIEQKASLSKTIVSYLINSTTLSKSDLNCEDCSFTLYPKGNIRV
jgi:hypothetical protein